VSETNEGLAVLTSPLIRISAANPAAPTKNESLFVLAERLFYFERAKLAWRVEIKKEK